MATAKDSAHGTFVTTQWRVVEALGNEDGQTSEAAWDKLIQIYWLPIYSYFRRRGNQPADAQDFTQEFFVCLTKRPSMRSLKPCKTRFRSYLLTCAENFLIDHQRKATSKRKQNIRRLVYIDPGLAEQSYLAEMTDHTTPESIFERQCAAALLDQALFRLEEEWTTKGELDDFNHLKPFLMFEDERTYAELAEQRHLTIGAVKMRVQRLRRRFHQLLVREVAATVEASDVEDELRHIRSVLTSNPPSKGRK